MSDSTPKQVLSELLRLREENARLKSLLTGHGIPWEEEPDQCTVSEPAPLYSAESDSKIAAPSEKVALFRRLFRGRADVYAVRWESTKGKSGYAPACGNEWKHGVCLKPNIKCAECDQRLLLPLIDQVIYDHLSGKHTVGTYPLLSDDTCQFLAIDFDGADWREDARAFIQSGKELNVPAALEISRSGRGAHVWIFFSEPVLARQARQLGSALISHTCIRTRQLKLSSYDRLFPNQDTLPKGGFGNLIALPLQKKARERRCSIFVNEKFEPFEDQWAFLASVTSMNTDELEKAIQRATSEGHPLDVAFVEEEDEREPWKKRSAPSEKISGLLPASLKLVIANQIFIKKADLPQPLANRLIRLAAFQNPEFYKTQAMRLPVWNKPRVIGCAENFSNHIGLPRGCLDAVQDLLIRNKVKVELQDERQTGTGIRVDFRGSLRAEQSAALETMLLHDTGVLCAPTAFGKTVTAAALIAKRSVSTLILVHRIELLKQWRDRLNVFLDIPKGEMGMMGGGKWEPSYHIDIAAMQSLLRRGNLTELLDHYGQIIIDECHHLSAFSFESILKIAKARYIIGLTATPVRRDGHQPIIFMQCGPLRHTAAQSRTAPTNLEVWPRMLEAPLIKAEADIQEVFQALFTNVSRKRQIVQDIVNAYQEGRKIIVLTGRTEHLSLLRGMLGDRVDPCYVLHGRIPKKQRAELLENLKGLQGSTFFVLLATGSLIGEGFDHPPLDTMVLAMPISWNGTLQQYAGRLHREYAGKQDVRIYDYVEYNHPRLNRMWNKRLRGYRNMGYEVKIS